MNLEDLKNRLIHWNESDLSPYTFETVIDGEIVRLRLNDFPEENIATLMLQDDEIEIDEFPNNWVLPNHKS